jgi:hypothetical protein
MPNPAPLSPTLPHPANYTSTLSGVMTDNVTGLMWQQPLDPVTCAKGCKQVDAAAFCASLALGNHHDWRLPTRIELFSLVVFTRASPAIDPVFTGTPPTLFWTSSPYTDASSNSAWIVNFVSGSAYFQAVTDSYNVRCVRQGGA